MKKNKKVLLALLAGFVVVVSLPLVAAYEAHVINVTAKIENALYVHPESQIFGTVFPQEKLFGSFFVTTSESFSAENQTRVKSIDYVIKQKPKPKDTKDAKWCHENLPEGYYQNPPIITPLPDEYLAKCYPVLCYYLSKLPDNVPSPGNDKGLPSYHPLGAVATGTINKVIGLGMDPADQWIIDLDVPCFKGECAQDWTHQGWEPPAKYDGTTFGCDLWIEVTKIY
jgi:hypothetical protein